MHDESEVLLTPPLHLQGSLRRERFYGQSDRSVQDTVQDKKGLPLETQSVRFGQVVDTAAQNVVLRHDFLEVESLLQAL